MLSLTLIDAIINHDQSKSIIKVLINISADEDEFRCLPSRVRADGQLRLVALIYQLLVVAYNICVLQEYLKYVLASRFKSKRANLFPNSFFRKNE